MYCFFCYNLIMKQVLKNLFLACLATVLLNCPAAEAHRPNFADTQTNIKISEPEISQAFYGTLNGKAAIYEINSSSNFQLYVGLLSPDISETRTNFSAAITNKGKIIDKLSGENFIWKRWYEEFAGDWYWQGPDMKKAMPAGDYFISVSNPNNQGKYVLVVGEAESFPILQIPHTFSELIKIKTQFFGKSWQSAFTNKIGLYTGLGLLVTIIGLGALVAIFFLVKSLLKNRRVKSEDRPL